MPELLYYFLQKYFGQNEPILQCRLEIALDHRGGVGWFRLRKLKLLAIGRGTQGILDSLVISF